jgi:hypothetical protein
MNDDILHGTITDAEIARVTKKSRATVRRWAQLGLLGPKVGPAREPRRRVEIVRRALTERSNGGAE